MLEKKIAKSIVLALSLDIFLIIFLSVIAFCLRFDREIYHRISITIIYEWFRNGRFNIIVVVASGISFIVAGIYYLYMNADKDLNKKTIIVGSLTIILTLVFIAMRYDKDKYQNLFLWLWDIKQHMLVFLLTFVLSLAIVWFIYHNDKGISIDLAAITMLCVSLGLLYQDYLFGNSLFVFRDIASDSIIQTYPNLVSTAYRISNGIWGELVDFCQGLGNQERAIVLEPGNWFCVLGADYVVKWIGITHYLKALLAGILAYYWASIYSGNSKVSLIIGFGYAFCSEFTIRGAWYSYPSLALLLMFWLLTFELYKKRNIWFLLPFATITLFYSNSIYFCVFWGALLLLYILFRYMADRGEKIEWGKLCLCCTLYFGFAVSGMCDTLISQLEKTLSSGRFTSGVSNFSLDNFFCNKETVFAAFLRTISQNITGISEDYTGSINYLEDPAFYCGMLMFLLVPLAIYSMMKGKRRWYIFAVVGTLVYIIVEPIRILVNGFGGIMFKTSSQWIHVLMLIMAMELLIKLFNQVQISKKSIIILYSTALVIVTLLFAAICLGLVSRISQAILILLFLLVYVGILNKLLLPQSNYQKWSKVLCSIFVLEVIMVSWPSINDRLVMEIEEPTGNQYFDDHTSEAVKHLKNLDSDWHRIEKQYLSVGVCDSLVQRYYGVSSYIGGTEADKGILNIYDMLQLTKPNNHYLFSTGGNISASAVLGVKYYLSKSGNVDRYGLQLVEIVEDIYIFENQLALPIAYVYDTIICEEDFQQLSVYDRNHCILEACVVDGMDKKTGIKKIEKWDVYDFSQLEKYKREFTASDNIYQIENVSNKDVLILRMMMSEPKTMESITFVKGDGRSNHEEINYDEGEKIVEISCDDLAYLSFSDTLLETMDSVEFYVVDREIYYADLNEKVAKLKDNCLNVRYHDQIYNYIEGNISCDTAGALATSIPYNLGWKVIVDGQETETFMANTAFVGCYLEEGEHSVVIYYEGKNWFEANIFKILGFIFAIGLMVFGIYKKYKGRIIENDKSISSSTDL